MILENDLCRPKGPVTALLVLLLSVSPMICFRSDVVELCCPVAKSIESKRNKQVANATLVAVGLTCGK